MSRYLEIIWHGCDGSVWHVSGGYHEEDEGVILKDEPDRKLFDYPFETKWVKGPFGSKYQRTVPLRRDVVLKFQVTGPTQDEWLQRDSDFRLSWDSEVEGTLQFIVTDESSVVISDRSIGLRLLQEPVAYAGETSAGKNPMLTHDSELTVTAAAENPFYVDDTTMQEYVVETTSGTVTDFFEMSNDGDVDVWPWWSCSSASGGIQWTLPDYSFGSHEYRRATEDATKTVPLPVLIEDEHVTVMSDPDEEYLASDIDTNPWARTNGQELIYPIPKNTEPTLVPVSWTGAVVGDSIRLHLIKMYSRPWGVKYTFV